MKRLLHLFVIGFAFVALAAAGRPAVWTAEQKQDLDRVSAYLNSITTMTGDFDQIGPDGRLTHGRFFISKPGKMRFDYAPPSPTIVVSNGLSITVYNTRLNTHDSYPLASTPLNLLLSDRINLKNNTSVTGIARQDGMLIVSARSNDRRMTGNITIVFADPGLELRRWTVVDAQNLPTTVSLRNAQTGTPLDDALFGVKKKS